MIIHCHRCSRRLTRPPVVLGGKNFGPTCAAKVMQPKARKAGKPGKVRHQVVRMVQADLFAEVRV